MSIFGTTRKQMTDAFNRKLTLINSKIQKHTMNLKTVSSLILEAIEQKNLSKDP